MNIEQLKEAISNLENSVNDSLATEWKINKTVLQSILENYKELLKYKQESLALSPVTVGDTLYAVLTDEFLDPDDTVEYREIKNIVIDGDGTFFKDGPFDDVICDLEALLNHEPYCGRVIFTDEKSAIAELKAARKRLGYEGKL